MYFIFTWNVKQNETKNLATTHHTLSSSRTFNLRWRDIYNEPPCTYYLQLDHKLRNYDFLHSSSNILRNKKIHPTTITHTHTKEKSERNRLPYIRARNSYACVWAFAGGMRAYAMSDDNNTMRIIPRIVVRRTKIAAGCFLVRDPFSTRFFPSSPKRRASRRPVRNSYYGRFDAHGKTRNIPRFLLIIIAWSASKHGLLLTVIYSPRIWIVRGAKILLSDLENVFALRSIKYP